MTLARAGALTAFAAAALFFAVHLALGRVFTRNSDTEITRSIGFAVMILTLYVIRQDRAYLRQSIPLRLALGSASLLGLLVITPSVLGA